MLEDDHLPLGGKTPPELNAGMKESARELRRMDTALKEALLSVQSKQNAIKIFRATVTRKQDRIGTLEDDIGMLKKRLMIANDLHESAKLLIHLQKKRIKSLKTNVERLTAKAAKE